MTHQIVLGLGYGDEGKGTIVDWLCATRKVSAVIRFNGGPQAAHNVVLPNGMHHTFAQLGSGTFRGVPTHLSKYMLVNPMNLMREAEHIVELGFPNPLDFMTISEDALLVTPFHRAANRARERMRGDAAHGSCGQGIGETMDYFFKHRDLAPRVGDLRNETVLREKLFAMSKTFSRELPIDEAEWTSVTKCLEVYRMALTRMAIVPDDFIEKLLARGDCVFEGAQGIMLDQDYGFHPHTTWSITTDNNARQIALDAGVPFENLNRIGVTRTYSTRHGYGPFPSENKFFRRPERHNAKGEWQGAWRMGPLNLSMLNYAVRANQGIDEIALTHCDLGVSHPVEYQFKEIKLPTNHEEQRLLGLELEKTRWKRARITGITELIDRIEDYAKAQVGVTSDGPTSRHKKFISVPATVVMADA